ncbi:uncharacterized protein LOC133527749 [Cydia pomonella]|uniref:uncharacterized protein LOC133527749 n=1 Tax=Cydia pomonella TaxID=82600 RepID=UPI002ADE0490|nr:uncharacterized protein LOC133527749 [Cydia pomonella]
MHMDYEYFKKTQKRIKIDALDMRIDRLIAKYSNVCQADGKLQVHSKMNNSNFTNDSKRNTLTSYTKVPDHKTTRVHAYPLKSDHYFYKFQHSSDSDEENEQCYIRIACHDIDCTSNSNTDSELTLPATNYKRPNKNSAVKSNVKFEDRVKHVNLQTSFTNENSKKSYAEKTTYCRPINNSYDRYFVNDVMKKNAKLQMLLTKYVIRRHREKEKEKWNNYVNNQSFRDWSKQSSPSVYGKPESPLCNDDDTKSKLRQSDSCKEILHDFYDAKDTVFPEYLTEFEKRKRYIASLSNKVVENKQHYFLNISKGRKSCENGEQNDSPHPYRKIIDEPKTANDDQNHSGAQFPKAYQHLKQIKSAGLYHVSIFDTKQSRDVQTHITFGAYNTTNYVTNELDSEFQTTDNEIRAMIKDVNDVENMTTTTENHYAVAEPVYTLKEMSNATKTSIEVLENKLDTLINLFNSFVSDCKTKNMLSDKISTDTFIIDGNQYTADISTLKVENNKKKVSIVGNVMTNTSLCAIDSKLSPSHYLMNMKLNKILHEELDKSNKIRSEIQNMLKTNRSAIELNIDIPTKECSTEVTDSLSKTKLESRSKGVVIEDISYRHIPQRRPPDRRIAVNTEPLGLLTLLRLSTEAVKQVLSFIPDISWYLSRAGRPVRGSNDYVCNICGAAFARPSELGAHILRHDLGQSRDCSICRHTVDRHRPSQLFRCQHCGKLFTRAYCCELHQQCCGHSLRSPPSRALLR